MRIALTVRDFRPWRGGGEGYVFTLAKALAARGHEIHVFAANIGEIPAGIIPHVVPISGLISRRASFARRCAQMLSEGEENFDLIHGFGKSIRMDVFRPGGGVHKAWQDMDPLCVENRLGRMWRRFRRRLAPGQWLVLRLEAEQYRAGPDEPEIIANSQMVREHILRYYTVPEKRIHVIYNGVDTTRFSPANRERFRDEIRDKFGIDTSETVLLFIANNFRLKGLAPLVRAVGALAADHKHLRVLVIGRDHAERYKALARSFGCEQRLVFAGPMREPERAYAAADIFVHPTFYDPCANVTLEALASGLPVITSIHNGAGELITAGVEGDVVHPQDSEALAEAIKALLDPNRCSAVGRAARQLAEQHNMSRHVEEVLAVYDHVMARRKTPYSAASSSKL